MKSDIEELIRWVKDMNSRLGKNPRGSIEMKFYNCIPLHFYCRADSQIWVGPYLPGTASNNAITYEFYIDSRGGKLYEETFQDYWEGKRNVHIVCEDNEPLLGNQKRSIESVMRYFCEEMKKDDGTDIIGVVVIFKEKQNLRRTLFSCNKPYDERYNCYGLQEGAVGKLIELNKSEKRVVFFRDYTNDLSITLDIQGRDRYVRKIDLSIERFKKETDMSAILAAPIYCNHKMVGAVTFDFNKLSSKYQKSMAELKALSFGSEVSGDVILCSWLHMAESCARMITHMLGDEIETQYKDLYEEEWKPNDPI